MDYLFAPPGETWKGGIVKGKTDVSSLTSAKGLMQADEYGRRAETHRNEAAVVMEVWSVAACIPI